MVTTLTVTLRPSSPQDSARVIEIWQSAVDATHDFLSAEDRAAIEEEVRGFLPQAPLMLAVDGDDMPLGFMLVDSRHMEALFIAPEARGQGVGRLLVEAALAERPALTTDVNEQNAQAVGFYERLGFVATGRSDHDGQGRAYPIIHLQYKALSRLRERVG